MFSSLPPYIREMGIITGKTAQEDPRSFVRMSTLMFDTANKPGISTSNPFSSESSLRSNPVKVGGGMGQGEG